MASDMMDLSGPDEGSAYHNVSPSDGGLLHAAVTHTFVDGELEYAGGRFPGGPSGRRLGFRRPR